MKNLESIEVFIKYANQEPIRIIFCQIIISSWKMNVLWWKKGERGVVQIKEASRINFRYYVCYIIAQKWVMKTENNEFEMLKTLKNSRTCPSLRVTDEITIFHNAEPKILLSFKINNNTNLEHKLSSFPSVTYQTPFSHHNQSRVGYPRKISLLIQSKFFL